MIRITLYTKIRFSCHLFKKNVDKYKNIVYSCTGWDLTENKAKYILLSSIVL